MLKALKLASETATDLSRSTGVLQLELDADGTIRSVNDAAQALLTRQYGAVSIGSSLHHLVHPDDAARVEAAVRAFPDGDGQAELVTRMAAVSGNDVATYVQFVLSRAGSGTGVQAGTAVIMAVGWDVTSLMRQIHELEKHAYRDPLTGVANRSIFLDRLGQELARSDRSGADVAVIFADVDDFKLVNDTYGHDTGDRILIHIARRLGACLRPADTLARLGGDEFAVICPDVSSQFEGRLIAARLRHAASSPLSLRNAHVSVTLSVGVAFATDADRAGPGHDLLARADQEMYALKRVRGR